MHINIINTLQLNANQSKSCLIAKFNTNETKRMQNMTLSVPVEATQNHFIESITVEATQNHYTLYSLPMRTQSVESLRVTLQLC